jgi:hypothetical protein
MSTAKAHSTTPTAPEVTKRIAYNPENRDYDCFVAFDGDQEQYIGSAPSHSAGETICNTFVYDYYIDTFTPEKAVALLRMEVA